MTMAWARCWLALLGGVLVLGAAQPGWAAGPGDLPVATDARLGGDDTRTRFIVDVSKTINITAFTLANPYRVVVDIPQIVFLLPAKSGENVKQQLTTPP